MINWHLLIHFHENGTWLFPRTRIIFRYINIISINDKSPLDDINKKDFSFTAFG